ncbi:restriction endonuclease subunit S [Acinetobacter cumulans]|uniref:restriction endonuclease subunit S n=1 Tax=Acinetobacter cumulans TaxID=2136182 RepID=UPI001443A2B8
MSYPLIPLGQLAKFINGDRGKNYPSKDSFVDTGIPFINAGCLSDQWVLDSSKFNYISEEAYDRLSSGKIQKNDILFCLRGSVGKFAVIRDDNKGALASSLVILRGNDKVDVEYLKHYLAGSLCTKELDNYQNGAAQPNLSANDFKKFLVPLPPLVEQRRIASILDQADDLRKKRQQAIETLDQLLQATFIEMFGDPVSNPKGWDLVKVGEVVDEFIGGKNIECPDESDSDYKILKVSAVTSKVYKPSESKFAPNTFEPNPLAIVEKGDLLFSRANTTELVAATAYVWETPENIVLPDKLWKFSISDESKVNKLYLWDLFKNIEFRNELSKLSSGTSGSMKNISKGKLNELKMPLPPKELQDKFAEFSTKLWEQIKTSQQSSDSLDSLFKSLQNQAFNGTL